MSSFLIDEMFPAAAAGLLRDNYGHDAIHVTEVGLRGVANEIAKRVSDLAIQLHGRYSYSVEYEPLESRLSTWVAALTSAHDLSGSNQDPLRSGTVLGVWLPTAGCQ